LEEALDLSFDRLLMMMMKYTYIYIVGYDTVQVGMCVPVYQTTRCLNPKTPQYETSDPRKSTF